MRSTMTMLAMVFVATGFYCMGSITGGICTAMAIVLFVALIRDENELDRRIEWLEMKSLRQRKEEKNK